MQLIEDIGFDQSFSFIYSKRPGTPAATLPDDTPDAVKKARLARLQAAIDANAKRISAAMVGTMQSVLVEDPSRKSPNEISGRTGHMRSGNYPPPASLDAHNVHVSHTAASHHWNIRKTHSRE